MERKLEYHPITNQYLGPVSIVGEKVYAVWLKYLSFPQFVQLVGSQKADTFYAPLLACLELYEIDTKLRIKHFFAQVFHESGSLKWLEEIWGPTAAQFGYEGRLDLGNTQPGDGYRYRGRGVIQLTGRSNYQEYSKAKGVDFVANPDLVSSPEYAIDVAGWYWQKRKINRAADVNDLTWCTRLVNGGTNGIEDRKRWFAKAETALNSQPF